MLQASRRTGWTDSALIRLLARLTELDVRESPQTFADRLSEWLRWTDAMSLFTALQDMPEDGAPAAPLRQPAAAPTHPHEAACRRLQAELAQGMSDDSPWVPEKPNPRARVVQVRAIPVPSPVEIPADFALYRRHYQGRQVAMESGIEPLRARLRAQLITGSPEMASLAAVDAVMERVLGEHERRLLSAVPALLERRFTRLRAEALADDAAPARTAWLDSFHQDMHAVLLAELELRWQPIEGLLEALRSPLTVSP